MVTENAENHQNLKYPKSVFFIISNEFCERFSYYGIRTILTLYLKNALMYTEDTATVIYHVFTMFVYFFPIFGAILADSWLGKFRTILYVSMVYAVGQFLLSASSAPAFNIPAREFSLFGLFLIAVGTGGIKPCVSAFGGDQFILPQQERFLSTFFSLFYFSINTGSVISSFLTPYLRSSVACFGDTTCYSLAFLVPAVLMIISIVIFLLGKPLYKIVRPTGNVVVSVVSCISRAIYNKATSKGVTKHHWLDYADDKFDREMIADIRSALQVLKLFLPLPVFWALYDQQGSRWTIQASRMDGQVGSFLIQADQMQVVNPLLVVIFIPLFETCIYPLLAKMKIHTPLRKLTLGGLLAALAFVISAFLELQLENTYPVLPSQGAAQLRVFNTLDCRVGITFTGQDKFQVEPMTFWKNDLQVNGTTSYGYEIDYSECPNFEPDASWAEGKLLIEEAKAVSAVITGRGLSRFIDNVDKSRTGDPLVRALFHIDRAEKSKLKLVSQGGTTLDVTIVTNPFTETDRLETKPDKYDVFIDGQRILENVELKLGGVYTIVGYGIPSEHKYNATLVTVTQPNSVHILWMVPQYVVLTLGEVMFSVTGLEFAFTQAPISMKSLLQACWLLTVAFGNLIVVIVAETSAFDRRVYEFFLFAGLMTIDIFIFAIMARFYKYVQPVVTKMKTDGEEPGMELETGTVNLSYREDDK